jgi:uncharacterized protein YifN (PemK superfamily)
MKENLIKLLEKNNWNITSEVIKEAMNYDSCISWIVSSLIRYKDTHEFYEKYYDEIEEIRSELDLSLSKMDNAHRSKEVKEKMMIFNLRPN